MLTWDDPSDMVIVEFGDDTMEAPIVGTGDDTASLDWSESCISTGNIAISLQRRERERESTFGIFGF